MLAKRHAECQLSRRYFSAESLTKREQPDEVTVARAVALIESIPLPIGSYRLATTTFRLKTNLVLRPAH